MEPDTAAVVRTELSGTWTFMEMSPYLGSYLVTISELFKGVPIHMIAIRSLVSSNHLRHSPRVMLYRVTSMITGYINLSPLNKVDELPSMKI